ncbi:hypothetical protein PIB30_075527 [Stylosanthes scabra]|uniref:Uncharacterized protein n=1 Tax=Stylosanthes scabra TaxID=79078 RepID=A0ABU6QR83_9FABA|nr:hypothetical protein [Stylosanthes scabra]
MYALALKEKTSPKLLTAFSSSLTPQSFNPRGIDTHFTVLLLDMIRYTCRDLGGFGAGPGDPKLDPSPTQKFQRAKNYKPNPAKSTSGPGRVAGRSGKSEERKLEEQNGRKLEHYARVPTPRRGDSRLGVQSSNPGVAQPCLGVGGHA